MTRRALFATIAAAFAGRRIAPRGRGAFLDPSLEDADLVKRKVQNLFGAFVKKNASDCITRAEAIARYGLDDPLQPGFLLIGDAVPYTPRPSDRRHTG